MPKKSTHGGPRQNAVRPLDPNSKRQATFRLIREVLDYLATVENKTATIENAVTRTHPGVDSIPASNNPWSRPEQASGSMSRR
jgi:hypothetical protein